MSFFTLEYEHKKARAGRFVTAHGEVETPIFMPVGTRGSVKGLTQDDLDTLGAQIILGNTYHLYLRPGHDLIEKTSGDLHTFMSWKKPILTDSGGFQVFSLADLNKRTEQGVEFRSHIDGSKHLITPEKSMEIQKSLGSDIVMAFDECPALPATNASLRESMELTLRWAKRCKEVELRDYQKLFGIVQGGLELDLRKECLERLEEMDFPGLAIGGLSVGEKNEQMQQLLADFAHLMPKHKPRYLMGVGKPMDILNGIKEGIDMFDCVLPTRNARNGQVFTFDGPLNIKNEKHKYETGPLDENCSCAVCSKYSRHYLRHLINVGEYTGGQLLSYHNLAFYIQLVQGAREAIKRSSFDDYYEQFYKSYS